MADSPTSERLVASAPNSPQDSPMPNDLYDRDVLAWSEHQADLLRRLARGEHVNDVDWEHVIDEIESVGRTGLNDLTSYLRRMLVQLLKVLGWPESPCVHGWRAELVRFQGEAERRFAPSMRRRIDVRRLYADAVQQLEPLRNEAITPLPWSTRCPVTLDQLLNDRWAELERTFQAASPKSSS
jgi:Domain of unknown function DUF29